MTDKPKFYKVLSADGRSIHGGDLKWSLPTQNADGTWKPGKWHHIPADTEISVCNAGFHLTTEPYNWFKWNSVVYEAEGKGDSDVDGNKTAFRHARLLRPVDVPEWLQKARDFVDNLKLVAWLKPDGNPDPSWKLYPNRNAAWDAAWAAARAAARNAARDTTRDTTRDAARDAIWAAALFVWVECICSDPTLDEIHREIARRIWAVWEKGYGLAAEVDGVLYVYEKIV